MERSAIHREIEKTKKILENPLLKHNERHSLETYLISLTKENVRNKKTNGKQKVFSFEKIDGVEYLDLSKPNLKFLQDALF